jgi:hypothetical protein
MPALQERMVHLRETRNLLMSRSLSTLCKWNLRSLSHAGS